VSWNSDRIRTLLYVAGVIALGAWLFLSPLPWRGTSYNGQHRGGTFGLDEDWAPLDSPPRAGFDINSDAWEGTPAQAVVRLPGAPITARHHIEIDPWPLAWRGSVGIVLLGLLCCPWRVWSKAPVHLRLTGTVAVGLAASWLTLFVLGMFSMGYALSSPELVGGVFSVGIAGGLAFGILGRAWSARRASTVRVQSRTAAKCLWCRERLDRTDVTKCRFCGERPGVPPREVKGGAFFARLRQFSELMFGVLLAVAIRVPLFEPRVGDNKFIGL
jgi:hypothetical protein